MKEFERERQRMVRHQLLQQGIQDGRVLEAMGEVPRHRFLDPDRWEEAYAPRAVPIGRGQTISQPYMVAVMTELLALEGNERVLEIGTGSGYQAAVLSKLAAEVITVECIDLLARSAHALLQDLGCSNVEVVQGDGSLGWPDRAPYDRILITAAAPRIPPPVLEQLADPGLLVTPVGDRQLQELWIVRREGGRETVQRGCTCRFVPLVGSEGFASET